MNISIYIRLCKSFKTVRIFFAAERFWKELRAKMGSIKYCRPKERQENYYDNFIYIRFEKNLRQR